MAFHDGGVARCGGCHVMHGELAGQIVMIGNAPLLAVSSPTDLCLTCHGGDNGVFGLSPLNPPPERGAGNFVFLLEDNLNDGPDGQTNPIDGAAAGHSVVSLANGLTPDPQWLYGPGGNYPTNELSCISCHDPHGNANFRLLYGVGPIQDGLFVFANPAPEAVGLSVTDPLSEEADDNHTAYRSGMSQWCANCHGQYHDGQGEEIIEHEFDEDLSGEEQDTYNMYNGDADPGGGNAATAYLAAVPFESAGAMIENEAGPSPGSRVMCLTCHRAHGSSAPHALRWDIHAATLGQDGVISGSYPIANPYPDSDQKSLCAKCHSSATKGDGDLPQIEP
jgi:predicted CXXCH cytochrome family protein